MPDERRRPRPAPTDRADRRQALVAAAFARIAQAGFEGLRTRDVAADVGVNVATLHYYFPTKEALIRGVIGFAVQRFQATLPRQGTPIEQLRGHLRALATLLSQDPRLWAVMSELALRAPRDADLQRIFGETERFWHRTLRDLIAACIAEGSVDPRLDADDLAALIIVAIRGASLPTIGGSRSVTIERLFRQFDRLLGVQEG